MWATISATSSSDRGLIMDSVLALSKDIEHISRPEILRAFHPNRSYDLAQSGFDIV